MKALIKVFSCLLIVAFLTSCGGGGDSGGAERLRTVQVLPPTLDKSIIEADVADCKDINGDGFACDEEECEIISSDSDYVITTISVKALPNLPSNLIASPISIKEVEINYVPSTNGLPTIPTFYGACPGYIAPNSSMTCKINIVPLWLKKGLSFGTNGLVCSKNFHQYYVQLKFKVIEVKTDKEGTVETFLSVVLADFAESQ